MELLGDCHRFASHVAVACGLAVYGVAESEAFFNRVGGHVETWHVVYDCRYFRVRKVDFGCAVGVYAEADGTGFADCVCHLYEHAVSHAGRYEILGDMACGVCSRTVDFRRVFA